MHYYFIILAAVAVHIASGLSQFHSFNRDSDQLKPTFTNSWAVEVRGGPEVANEIAAKNGFTNMGQIGSLTDMYHFILPLDAGHHRLKRNSDLYTKTTALKSEKSVGYVQRQKLCYLEKKYTSSKNDPLWSFQWNVKNTGQTGAKSTLLDIKAEPAWIQGYTGKGTTVGLVDDGLDHSHLDLIQNYASLFSYDFNDNDWNPFPAKGHHHGTSCSGIIAMTRNNNVCGVGVAYDAKVAGLRILGGDTTDALISSALSHLHNNIDIYSNSWGPADYGFIVDGPSYLTKRALRQGATRGRRGKGNIFTWAGGNGGYIFHDSCSADGYSQSIYSISVGAYSDDGSPAYYDEKCSAKQTVAYVESIHNSNLKAVTLNLTNQCTKEFDGTSAATPYVSAVIALTLQARPDLTWRDIQYLIAYTSNPDPLLSETDDEFVNGAGLTVSHQFGFGAIDAEAMVTRAQHWTNVPQQIINTITPSVTSGKATYYSPLNITFKYSGQIRYVEHIVVTLTVRAGGYRYYVDTSKAYHTIAQDYYYNDLYPSRYKYRAKRGDIKATLTSPMGSTSTLLFNRPYDIVTTESYYNWPLLSVLHWGENPAGQWTVRISWGNYYRGYTRLSNIHVTLYGVPSVPSAVSSIPSQCDSACARSKGCAAPGPQYCDACKSTLLRDATTKKCIQHKDCVSPNKIASGYCYAENPSGHVKPSSTQANPSYTNAGHHPSATKRAHPSSTAGHHPSATKRAHPSSTAGHHPSATKRAHPSSTAGHHPSATKRAHPSSTAGHRPSAATSTPAVSSGRVFVVNNVLVFVALVIALQLYILYF